MAGKTDTYSDSVLGVLKGQACAGITPRVGLFSTAPTDAGGGTELTGAGGYARQAITFGNPANAAGGGRQIANSVPITFGPATGADWPEATHFGIFDAAEDGGLRYWAPLAAPKTIRVGDSGSYAIGELVVVED